jgi:predicted methyltransferase
MRKDMQTVQPMTEIILSHYQVIPLLQLKESSGSTVRCSLDLNITFQQGLIIPQGIKVDGYDLLTWESLQEIASTKNSCFILRGNQPKKIMTFSDLTHSTYSLYPTESAPTMLISGLPMHRIKATNPYKDTQEKIKAVRPSGRVLDTATGLGYTAIAAAKKGDYVLTVELDPAAQEICRQNPWSQDLFDNPRIEQRIGDSFDIIETLEDAYFHRILHDPPTISLAGHLYSQDFYTEMYRVLRPGGRAFHYIGDPQSKSGRRTTAGVIQRLERVGFSQVHPAPRAFGVVAVK